MPAHSSGAVAAKSNPAGTSQDESLVHDNIGGIASRNVCPPKCLSSPLYVKVGKDRQYCSKPARQLGQVRHESTMHPTAPSHRV